MGKTFDQSLIDVANISMSMIDPADLQDTNSEEFLGLRRIQQGCHNELSNREDFPFNKYTKTIQTIEGATDYTSPDGTILGIYTKGSSKGLTFDKDLSLLTPSVGKPVKYGLKYSGNSIKISLYPTPDDNYTIDINYLNTKNVVDIEGNASYIITVGSTLRMPERVQHLYFDALEYYVLADYMRKQSNARWQPTMEIFEARWKVFLKACQPTDVETYFVI